MENDNHCYECAGQGKARGYECATCDGTGKLKKPNKIPKKAKAKSK